MSLCSTTRLTSHILERQYLRISVTYWLTNKL